MRKVVKVLDGVTATTTSAAVDILGAKRVTLFCKRADHSSGSSAFTAEVGVGTDYVSYKKWISNANNTNVQGETRVTTLTLSANGIDFVSMSPEDIFEFIKVTVTETTDGTHSAWLVIDYADDQK
jgi:hypothetical protein